MSSCRSSGDDAKGTVTGRSTSSYASSETRSTAKRPATRSSRRVTASGTSWNRSPNPDSLDTSISFDTMVIDMTNLQVIGCCVPLGTPAIADAEAEATAHVFKALSDPARVKILSMLATAGEPVCACEFTPALGLSQATVSHHLKKLTETGLLERE